MAQLPVQSVQNVGTALVFGAATAGGDAFGNTGQETIELVNTNASPVTVTFVGQNKCNFGSTHNIVVTVPATTGRMHVTRLNPQQFNDSSGNAQITYSAVTALTVAVYR